MCMRSCPELLNGSEIVVGGVLAPKNKNGLHLCRPFRFTWWSVGGSNP